MELLETILDNSGFIAIITLIITSLINYIINKKQREHDWAKFKEQRKIDLDNFEKQREHDLKNYREQRDFEKTERLKYFKAEGLDKSYDAVVEMREYTQITHENKKYLTIIKKIDICKAKIQKNITSDFFKNEVFIGYIRAVDKIRALYIQADNNFGMTSIEEYTSTNTVGEIHKTILNYTVCETNILTLIVEKREQILDA